MKKVDLINALGRYKVAMEEMNGQTMSQMGTRLSELRKKEMDEREPEKPENMKVVEVVRSYTRKVNLGNYESRDFFCSKKAEVPEGEDHNKVSRYLAFDCLVDVENQIEHKDSVPF